MDEFLEISVNSMVVNVLSMDDSSPNPFFPLCFQIWLKYVDISEEQFLCGHLLLTSQLVAEMLALDSVTDVASRLTSGDVTGNRARERSLCLFEALEIWITASVGERINDVE
jgi:hypothetical protein